jgi:N-acetylmuramic acid 6-phosphate etherase
VNAESVVIALDLGGTWIKGCAATLLDTGCLADTSAIRRWRNPLQSAQYAKEIQEICSELALGREIRAVVASTAGEVDALGRNYLCAGKHLGAMVSTPWVEELEANISCPVTLINDVEAFTLGLTVNEGTIPYSETVGGMAIGTGIGLAMVRDGRWWKPARRLNHLGAIKTQTGDYNAWASAVAAAELADGNLERFLLDDVLRAVRQEYFRGISQIAATAVNLYHLDRVVIGGGLVDAAIATGFDLVGTIFAGVPELLLPGFPLPGIQLAKDGNATALKGALAIASGNAVAEPYRFRGSFGLLETEQSSGLQRIELLSATEIARHLAKAEANAAADFVIEADALGRAAECVAAVYAEGGRVIYVGAGTSGRVGALDAVEIPCTFGATKDRFVAVIAGGVADAALTIEENFEEDCSSVPDLLLLQISAKDIVIAISASGSAFFARSALAFAKTRGARTIFIRESRDAQGENFSRECIDITLHLRSGPELVSGSTRMKAGTATKKALNILSTTAMIRLGKVQHGYMVDLHCTNSKLRTRAAKILQVIAGIGPEEAIAALERNGWRLKDALEACNRLANPSNRNRGT